MEIHRPKAAHSWREFAIEIGTIICGIVIALGLEQLIEAAHWRREAAETRKALSVEMASNLAWAEQRARNSVCVQRRLDELAVIVDAAAQTGRLPPLPEPHKPMVFLWGAGVWQTAVSNGTAAHLRPAELRGYSDAYKFINQVDAANQEEGKVWTTLYGMAGPGRRLEPGEVLLLRGAIGQARSLDGYIGGMGVRARQTIDGYRIGFDQRRYDQIMRRPIQDLPICQPLVGPPPAHYGVSPDSDFALKARQFPMRPAIADQGR